MEMIAQHCATDDDLLKRIAYSNKLVVCVNLRWGKMNLVRWTDTRTQFLALVGI